MIADTVFMFDNEETHSCSPGNMSLVHFSWRSRPVRQGLFASSQLTKLLGFCFFSWTFKRHENREEFHVPMRFITRECGPNNFIPRHWFIKTKTVFIFIPGWQKNPLLHGPPKEGIKHKLCRGVSRPTLGGTQGGISPYHPISQQKNRSEFYLSRLIAPCLPLTCPILAYLVPQWPYTASNFLIEQFIIWNFNRLLCNIVLKKFVNETVVEVVCIIQAIWFCRYLSQTAEQKTTVFCSLFGFATQQNVKKRCRGILNNLHDNCYSVPPRAKYKYKYHQVIPNWLFRLDLQ